MWVMAKMGKSLDILVIALCYYSFGDWTKGERFWLKIISSSPKLEEVLSKVVGLATR